MPASLVIQTSFLGDTVLTTPLIARLAERGPVDVVVTAAAAGILANNPAIRELVIYDKRGRDRGVGGFVRLARRLRARRYDSAYLAQGSLRSGALALVAGVRRRVGFATSAGRITYTTRVRVAPGSHHVAKLARLGGGDAPRTALQPRLFPGDAEKRAVSALLGEDDRPLVALAPGSVWATKRWPYYPQLAAALVRDARIVVVGGAADTPLAREIASSAGDVIDATGKLSLLASAELIRRASVLVTNDSAPLHLASATGTPTVAIFGPTVPAFGFGPLAARSAIVGDELLACRPCSSHGPQRCPLGHWRCMRETLPGAVATIVRGFLPLPSLA